MNINQKITVVILDLALIAELFVAMYLAHQTTDDFNATFCKVFFAMLVPTLAAGVTTIRCLREKNGASPEAA